jgi:hypothetical protein
MISGGNLEELSNGDYKELLAEVGDDTEAYFEQLAAGMGLDSYVDEFGNTVTALD